MTTTENTTATTKSDITLALINLDPSETITFTAGRNPITATRQGGIKVEGVNKVFAGEKVAAGIIAALVRG